LDDKQFSERTNRRYRHPAPAPGRGGRADDLMPSQLADTMTDEEFQRRLEHKYGHRWVRMPNGEPATTGQRSSEGKAKVQGEIGRRPLSRLRRRADFAHNHANDVWLPPTRRCITPKLDPLLGLHFRNVLGDALCDER
jgi:hypothetical protein